MHITKTSVRSTIELLLLSLYLLSGAAHADEKQRFDEGVRLFGSGDYAAAAKQFELALTSESDNPIIHYNLGSSYYKLGRYSLARDHFQKIDTRHKLAAVAYYNLGLIAFRLEGKQAAIRWFQRCLDSSNDKALTRLANKQLKLLREEEQTSSWRDSLSGYFSASIGYDNNVARVPDEILQVSNHGSSIADLFLSSSYWLNGNYRRGNALKFGGGLTHYDELNEYSSNLLNIGLYHYRPAGGWHSRYGIHYYRTELNGTGFQQRFKLQARAGKKYAPNQHLRLQYEYSRIDELSTTYDYLAGSLQRLKIENRTRLTSGRLRLGYTLELNDKQDYRQADTFSSYSPTRQTLYLRYKRTLGENWIGRIGVDYRHSNYIDENIVNGISVGVRKDQRLRATVGAIYKYSPDIELEIMLRHTENNSNLANKEYTSNQLLFTVGRYF